MSEARLFSVSHWLRWEISANFGTEPITDRSKAKAKQTRNYIRHSGCVPFSESKNGFLMRDLPDFAAERNTKSEIGSVTLVTFCKCVRCGGLARNDVFSTVFLLDNFLISDSTSVDGRSPSTSDI